MSLRIAAKLISFVRLSVVSSWIAHVKTSKNSNGVFFCDIFFSNVEEWTNEVKSGVLEWMWISFRVSGQRSAVRVDQPLRVLNHSLESGGTRKSGGECVSGLFLRHKNMKLCCKQCRTNSVPRCMRLR